jgi:mono/diheme cytochrome c family protein
VTGRILATIVLACALAGGSATRAQSPQASSSPRPDYDIDYLGPPLADPLMQHAKETYVSFGCAYCHGVTLIARGEAADLMHSALVGADVDGSTIVPLLKAGIPQTPKLSPMPQFSDLSDQQLHAIARYIHYARQQGRLRELTQTPPTGGDSAAGKTYFDQRCSTCHGADLNGIARKYDDVTLRERMLAPKRLEGAVSFAASAMQDERTAAARQRHAALLENYAAGDVANLLAYLKTR